MKKMNIALVSSPWYPVPPHGYGGIELVVGLLAAGLRRRGHMVHLFGAEGSDEGTIVCAPKEWREDLGRPQMSRREAAYAGRVYRALTGLIQSLGPVDIIHEHSGMVGLLAAQYQVLGPVVHTVHGPLDESERTAYVSVVDGAGLIAISQNQRESAPELNWVGTVHNAVDVNSLRVGIADSVEPYLLVLARICPEKGQHLAVEVAQRVGMKLVLAGKVENTAESIDYFRRMVSPHIDGDRVVHILNVAGDEKADLLSNATAMLAPITWPEPFGLSIVEAMASGTPAIAMNLGAVNELIEDGRTGYVVEDVDGMVEAVLKAREMDHVECALRARQLFSPDAMVDRYLDVYAEFIEANPRRHTGSSWREVWPGGGGVSSAMIEAAAPTRTVSQPTTTNSSAE
jgi:glycosyltransferase involved in cell wall biosynthesis